MQKFHKSPDENPDLPVDFKLLIANIPPHQKSQTFVPREKKK
jgi:hypothetical protein